MTIPTPLELAAEPITLMTKWGDDRQVDSVIPLRWCISRETAEMLERREIEDPYMLLVVEHDGQEMDRYVVPLLPELCFVQFRRPGENVIHATIVWKTYSSDGSSAKKILTARYSDTGIYKATVLTAGNPAVEVAQERVDELRAKRDADSGEAEAMAAILAELDQAYAALHEARKSEIEQHFIPKDFDSISQLGEEVELSVMVPEEMFAQAPPKWMTWLGNRYTWTRAPRDQCDLRRRALFTAATQPLVLGGKLVAVPLITIVNLAIIGVLLLFGRRGIDFGPLRHPLSIFPAEAWDALKPSIWWSKAKVTKYGDGESYTSYSDRHPAFLVLNPPAVVGFVLVGVVLNLVFGSILFIVVGAAAAFAIGLIVYVASLLGRGPISRLTARRGERRRLEDAAALKASREYLRHSLEELVCDGRPREASLSALPKDRRTMTLRFQNTKSRVCRPFAR